VIEEFAIHYFEAGNLKGPSFGLEEVFGMKS
jgi:hypothetical protein